MLKKDQKSKINKKICLENNFIDLCCVFSAIAVLLH